MSAYGTWQKLVPVIDPQQQQPQQRRGVVGPRSRDNEIKSISLLSELGACLLLHESL